MSCLLSISSQRAQVGLFTVKVMRAHPNCTADIIHLQAVELEVYLKIIKARLRNLKALIRTKVTHSITQCHTRLKLHNRNSLPHYQLYI